MSLCFKRYRIENGKARIEAEMTEETKVMKEKMVAWIRGEAVMC